jgi:UDP-N-acetylglucosamine--N-acetylmuramyl-(pentapeptide) pyrophosphoryl-undecaprenol N-acetylglucosamine transferase
VSAPTLIFAGGGTGGHVFPLLAVARAVTARADVRCLFVGTERGLEARVIPAAGFQLELLPVLPLRGRGLKGAARGAKSLLDTLPRALELVRAAQPRATFSLGGYAAAPFALAARLVGVPLAVMEPNSVPGFANRAVAPFAARVYLAFEESARYFRTAAVRRLGVAIRDGFNPVSPISGLGQRPARLLVLGGSQGARALNERVPRALSELGVPFEVHHQAGRGNGAALEVLYRELGVDRYQVSEFIDDMPSALGAADLVISRAGASAIAEICAIGRPSVLLPLATAAGDHQRFNALALERAGAAVCLSAEQDTVGRLSSVLRELLSDGACLTRMGRAALAWGQPHAAAAVAQDLLSFAGIASREPTRVGAA